ncbi:MAG TPA: CoA transferase [Burkholderiales bacterium]|nr:CoA transferase [Burkholderiales bacterium]
MSRLNGWLHGVRVLDLSRYIPGPLATMLLADMGAEVLKIEGPEGDEMQHLGPRDAAGAPIFYPAINAGKAVRRMNLKDASARAEFLQRVESADVLVESFRPGVMARLGLGYDALRAVNPRLIYCALSGYGANGPLAQAAGHDANYLALTGILHRNAGFFDPPVCDNVGALFAVIAILGALQGRARDGRGCEIDMSLADSIWPLQTFQVADYGARGYSPGPEETYLNGGAAWYQVYRTRDGARIALGTAGDKFWERFCRAAGRPEWIARAADPMPQRALMDDVQALIGALTLAECNERFGAADCCYTPVLTLAQAVQSEQTHARQLVRRASTGALQALFPAWVDEEPPAARPPMRHAP